MDAIKKAIEVVGGMTKLARIIGVAQPTVHQWTVGQRPVPVERCPLIEEATGGAVRVDELRPDVVWQREKDKKTGKIVRYLVEVQRAK